LEGGSITAVTQQPSWTPSEEQWRAICRANIERPAVATITRRGGKSRATVRFSTSRDEVGAPIFYREVNLPFSEAVKDPSGIRWRFGPVSSKNPPVVLENLPVCANCHSFTRDGRTLGMDVDYANDKGSYVVTAVAEHMTLAKGDVFTWSDFRRQDKVQTFGLLSQVSPDGRYVISTVKDRSVFVAVGDIAFSQLFFPVKGILAVYDRQAGTFSALAGADDVQFIHSNPSWSPDGRQIVFARAPAYRLDKVRSPSAVLLTEGECREFLKEGKTFRYDLYRIPFNDGKGGRAEPIAGASGDGMSNFFARYSPDGKWIVFCKAKSFMLLQPDSELYIVPAEGGGARRLRCNTRRMNSWHTWSPNGRWLAFSSKLHGPYTEICLTHIDAEGNSTPPVVLTHFTAADRAANIPEFVNVPAETIRGIREQFLNAVSYVRSGNEFRTAGDLEGAEARYRKALAMDPNNAEAHTFLGFVLMAKGILDQSERHLREAIRLAPGDPEAYFQLGVVMVQRDQAGEARELFAKAIHVAPDYAPAHAGLGLLAGRQGELDEAIRHCREAVRLMPAEPAMHADLGLLYLRSRQLAKAEFHLAEAVRLKPDDGMLHYHLAGVLAGRGRLDEATRHGREAVRRVPNSGPAHAALGTYLLSAGRLEESVEHLLEALRLEPADAAARSALVQALGPCRRAGKTDLARRIESRLTGPAPPQPQTPSHANP
jgi:Flp pilus assembly protein TadD